MYRRDTYTIHVVREFGSKFGCLVTNPIRCNLYSGMPTEIYDNYIILGEAMVDCEDMPQGGGV